jgi:hypothetical protein
MDPLREFGKTLILLGVIVAGLGGILFLGGRLPLRLGRLPGDTLVMWLVRWLRK